MMLSLLFITACTFAADTKKQNKSQTPTEFIKDFTYELDNPADLDKVFITVNENNVIRQEYISPPKDYDINICYDEPFLFFAKFNRISESFECKFQHTNMKTLIADIETGLNNNSFYRKI